MRFFRRWYAARATTLVELMVAVSISALVMSGVASLMYISGRTIFDLYATSHSRAERSAALNQIRFRLSDAKQGTVVVSDSEHRIRFHDPNLGVGVTSEFQFDANDRILYYTPNIANAGSRMAVAKGPINITFTLGSLQLDPPSYTTWNGQDGVVTLYVQTSADLAWAQVDLRDGESVVHMRNTTDAP